ncbi:unnamed protein product [Moneuplotes crassus]|uniref:Uncharacterized protein n=1 Tax=Euplotes crassus TaxID=5936 RepID=A0AAD1XJY9_EUPCR|nr:unnamed protein product [Moneuplotes crassus]
MAEVSKRLYTLTLHIYDSSLSTQKCKFSYKCEDSECLVKVDFLDLKMQYVFLKNSNLRLKVNKTQLLSSPGCISLRLGLDKTIMDLSDTTIKSMPCLIPPNISIHCNCGERVTENIETTINSPSAKWFETIELWKCHEEDYSHMLTDEKGKLLIAPSRGILNFTTLTVSKETLSEGSINGTPKSEIFSCLKCSQELGTVQFDDQYNFIIGRCLLFQESQETVEPFCLDLYKSFCNSLRSVYDENFTKDIKVSSNESFKQIYIKVLSMDSYVTFGNTISTIPKLAQKLEVCIKVLFSCGEEGIKLGDIKKCQEYSCTDNEILEIQQHLQKGCDQLPSEMRNFKKLFNVSYLNYIP